MNNPSVSKDKPITAPLVELDESELVQIRGGSSSIYHGQNGNVTGSFVQENYNGTQNFMGKFPQPK